MDRAFYTIYRQALSWLQLVLLLGAVSLFGTGCGDNGGGGELSVFLIESSTEFGHAPHVVTFEVDFARDEDGEDEFEIRWDFGDGATLQGETRVTHTYNEPGNYTATVTVENLDTGASGQDEVEIEVIASADLAVSGIQGRPFEIQAGQNLQALYSISSLAVEVEVPFTTIVFLTANQNAGPDDLDEFFVVKTERLEGFPAVDTEGSVLDREVDGTVPEAVPSGDYYVGVFVDSESQVGELDELNNFQLSDEVITVSNPSTDGPDLVPADVNVSPNRTRILSSATVDFTVENRGFSAALLFGYSIYMSELEQFSEENSTLLLEGTLPGVSTTESLSVDDVLVPIQPAITDPGDYYFFVVVDPAGDITEINENNNVAVSTNPLSVTDEPILDADIVVTEFRLEPDNTFLGGSVSAEIDLVNQGSQATGSFICGVYFSEDQVLSLDTDLAVGSVNLFDLEGETELTQQTTIPIPSFFSAGDYYAFVFCDSSGVVVEFDEDNNVQRYADQVSVALSAEVDLSAQGLTITPQSPIMNGTQIEVAFEACNAGSTGSSPNTVRVLLSQDNVPGPDDLIAFEGVLPGLEPGECRPFQANVDGSCVNWQSNYEVLVQLDVRDVLQETDEENNLLVLDGGLTIEGATCSCTADSAEPNNFRTVPFPLMPGTQSFSLCGGDSDWFRVSLQANESLVVTLDHDPSLGELDLALYGAGQEAIDRSGPSGGTETVDTFLVPVARDYLVQVIPAVPGQINIYDLTVEVIAPQTGVTDLTAVAITPETTFPELNTPFDVTFDVINLGDVAAGQSFRVSLFLSQDEIVDPMTDDELTQVEITSLAGYGRERLTVPVTIPGGTPSGLWRIGAYADVTSLITESDEANNGTVSNPVTVDTTCFDVLEPNDSLAAAQAVVPQEVDPAPMPNFTGLVVCKTNPDFYRIPVESGKELRFTVESDAAQGDLDIVLRDSLGNAIDDSRTTGDVEEVVLPITVGAQDYFLEVLQQPSQFNSDKSDYDLTVTMVDADPGLVCNAEFEPNNSFESSTSLLDAAANPQALATCPKTDDDYYQVFLSAGANLEVSLVTMSSDLRATLYDPSRNFIQTIFDPQTQDISFTAPVGGVYYLRVFAGAGASREEEYSLDVSGVVGTDLTADGLSLAPSAVNAGDPVQYNATVRNIGSVASTAFEVDIVLSTDPVIDGTDQVLGTQMLSPLASQGSVVLSDKVDIPLGTAGGQYYIGLLVDSQDAVTEINEFNNDLAGIVDVVAQCSADAFESPQDNNSSARATDLASAAPASASICPGDVDWYEVAATGGQQITFTATFSHASGDLDLYVYDGSLNRIDGGQGRSLTDNEIVSVTPAASGTVYVEVRGFTGVVANNYTLDFSTP